jgi:endonuclease/exonuclease/phosphatase family metal-dependent hydrolase
LLVRTWNLFHGNASPPERRAFLEQMMRLAVADAPDVVCLQELPVWSLRELEGWSGMLAVSEVTERPLLWSAELGRVLTDLHHGLLRSAFTGQANAVLVARTLTVARHTSLVLNPWRLRRREARRLRLGVADRIAWRKNRRLCQVLRLVRDGGTFVLGNLHASNLSDKRVTDLELLRAARFVDGFAHPDEPIVLAGDFNVTVGNSHVLDDLAAPEWGLEGATEKGIDHVLTRGFRGGAPVRWPVERRTAGARVLSDHAPVDRELA